MEHRLNPTEKSFKLFVQLFCSSSEYVKRHCSSCYGACDVDVNRVACKFEITLGKAQLKVI